MELTPTKHHSSYSVRMMKMRSERCAGCAGCARSCICESPTIRDPSRPNEVCFGHAVLFTTGIAKENVDLQTGAVGPRRSN